MARGKGEGALYKTNRGLWTASVELPPGPDGKRRRKVISSKSKATVAAKLREVQKEKSVHGDLSTRSMSLEAWLRHWLDEIAPQHLRPNTVRGYRSVVTQQIISRIGKTKLDKLTPSAIRSMTDDIVESGKTSTYALNAHNVLSSALKDAVRDGIITRHPMEHMRRPRHQAKEQNALTLPQAIDLLEHVADKPGGTLWATYLLTGARRNEVLGLEVDRITDQLDLSWQLQRIQDVGQAPRDYEYREIGGGYYFARPKSPKSWRIIPLVDPLKSILAAWVAQTQPSGLVFPREPGVPMNPDTVTRRWTDTLIAAGIEKESTPEADRVVLHGARHTVVDLLYQAGVPEDVIQSIMGHSTRSVTRGYQTQQGQSQRVIDAMQSMSDLFTRQLSS